MGCLLLASIDIRCGTTVTIQLTAIKATDRFNIPWSLFPHHVDVTSDLSNCSNPSSTILFMVWYQLVSRALVSAYRPWRRSVWRSEIWSRSQGKYDLGLASPCSGAVHRVFEKHAERILHLWSSFFHPLVESTRNSICFTPCICRTSGRFLLSH